MKRIFLIASAILGVSMAIMASGAPSADITMGQPANGWYTNASHQVLAVMIIPMTYNYDLNPEIQVSSDLSSTNNWRGFRAGELLGLDYGPVTNNWQTILYYTNPQKALFFRAVDYTAVIPNVIPQSVGDKMVYTNVENSVCGPTIATNTATGVVGIGT